MTSSSPQPFVFPSRYWMSFLIAVMAISLPVLIVKFFPFNDYPFHFARSLIIAGPDRAAFTEFYDSGSWLLPNLAQDIAVQILTAFFSAADSVKIFVWLTLFLQLAGAALLHRAAHGRLSVWPLTTVIVIYNGILVYGFLNFLFGFGVALFGLALWLRMRMRRWMLGITGLISCVLMMCHLEAMGVFAVGVAAIELEWAWRHWHNGNRWRVIRRVGMASLPFIVPVLLFLLISPTGADLDEGFGYPAYLPGKLLFGPLFGLSTRMIWLDLAFASAIAGILFWALITRRIYVCPPLLWAAIACGAAMLAMPKYVMGSDFADTRLAPVAVILALTAIDIGPQRRSPSPSPIGWSKNAGIGLTLLILGLIVLRTGALSWQWQRWDSEIATIVDDFQHIEPRAILYAAVVGPGTQLIPNTAESHAAWRPPVKHVASYAVLFGPVFVPMIFVDPHKQPIQITKHYQSIKALQSHNPFFVKHPEELAILIEQLRQSGAAGIPESGQNFYLSVVSSYGVADWPPPSGSKLISRSPRHMLLLLTIDGGAV